MCNCIEEIKQNIKEQKIDGKQITSVSFNNQGLTIIRKDENNHCTARSYEVFDCIVEGRKSTVQMKVFQSFCPFCGEKIGEKEN